MTRTVTGGGSRARSILPHLTGLRPVGRFLSILGIVYNVFASIFEPLIQFQFMEAASQFFVQIVYLLAGTNRLLVYNNVRISTQQLSMVQFVGVTLSIFGLAYILYIVFKWSAGFVSGWLVDDSTPWLLAKVQIGVFVFVLVTLLMFGADAVIPYVASPVDANNTSASYQLYTDAVENNSVFYNDKVENGVVVPWIGVYHTATNLYPVWIEPAVNRVYGLPFVSGAVSWARAELLQQV